MESIGAIHVGEWSGMCSSEEAAFMAELLGNCSLPNEAMSDSTNFIVSPAFNAMSYSCNESGGVLFPFSSEESYYSALSHHVSGTSNGDLMTMDYFKNGFQDEDSNNNIVGGDEFLNRDVSNDNAQSDNERGLRMPTSESRKRPRVPCDVPRSKKSTKCSNCPRDDDNNNNVVAVTRRQTSSNYCSEDESNEMNGTNSCSTSKGKQRASSSTRASRGSATDPQSLYARKRRERINERLKILQTLVPNGTKVDISTMLEEAVQYVKFLQLQIKLLSSDDLWMYSPIAYNGMDIGLDLRMASATQQSS